MAISRSQMQKQLQNRGGITNLSPRQNFGLGSSLKKFVRKIIPNEVSKVATVAAPFVAPFNPALAAGMAGIGSFDQTGSISDALKRGALTYGGGQAARYIGGAGFQANPFAQGGAFTQSGFTSGFSSPIGTETGLGKFFSKPNAPISEVQPLGYEASEMEIVGSNIPKASEMEIVGGLDKAKENVFKRIMNDPSVSNIGNEALNFAKKAGKAIFFDDKGNLDRNVLLGTIAFAASYAEAKSLANDVGVDLTESEYDEARKAEKQEQYAADLQNFFGGKKDGGRIGFAEGSEDKTIEELLREMDEEKISILNPAKAFKKYLIEQAGGGESRIETLTEDPFAESVTQMYVSDEMGALPKIMKDGEGGVLPSDLGTLSRMDFETDEDYDRYLGVLSKMKSRDMESDGGRIGYDEGGRSGVIGKIADLFFDEEGNYSKALQRAKFEFSKFVSGMGTDLDTGAEWYNKLEPNEQKAIIEEKIKYRQRTDDVPLYDERYAGTRGIGGNYADGGRIGLKEGSGSKKKYGFGIESAVKQIDPLQSGLNELKIAGGLPMGFSRLEKSFLFKNLAKLGGADRSFTMPQLYRILSDPSKFPKDASALKAFLKIKGFKKGGDVGTPTEVPVRTNEAGVKELDYRQSGGFVPVGVKEKADDVPAMLSKNEFVLTADAVRGIGGGSVEKGSEKLYNVMKQAEQVGKA